MMKEEVIKTEIFADPTYDITFKMLFASDKNKDVLISLLNSLLNFKGSKEIKDVALNSNELDVVPFSKDKSKLGVSSAVDVLCTTANGQKIAIEMQGQKTKYFLAREQEYMAKLLVGQVKEGQGKLYHEKVLETYIIVITKENVFTGKAEFEKQKLFEIDIEPRIVQTNEPYPDNKMHWKFFELAKFKNNPNYSKINKLSDLKEQWLEFLIECSKQVSEPERNDIIKKGYEIMKMSKWDGDTQALYWKQKQEVEDILREQEDSREEAFKEGEMKGLEKGLHEGLHKGKLKGELIGKVKGEVKQIKSFMTLEKQMNIEIPKDKYIQELNYTKSFFPQIKDYLNQSEDNFNKRDTMVCEELELIGKIDMDIEHHS